MRSKPCDLGNFFRGARQNNDVRKNRFERLDLQATVMDVNVGVARARLDGRVRLKHAFYHKDDDKVAEMELVGYVDFDTGAGTVRGLTLVTDRGAYGNMPFGVALRLVP